MNFGEFCAEKLENAAKIKPCLIIMSLNKIMSVFHTALLNNQSVTERHIYNLTVFHITSPLTLCDAHHTALLSAPSFNRNPVAWPRGVEILRSCFPGGLNRKRIPHRGVFKLVSSPLTRQVSVKYLRSVVLAVVMGISVVHGAVVNGLREGNVARCHRWFLRRALNVSWYIERIPLLEIAAWKLE